MTVWYARKGSCDISDTTLWSLNPSGDAGTYQQIANCDNTIILAANGNSSLRIDATLTCNRISSQAEGGTAGGGFTFDSITAILNGNVWSATSPCLKVLSGVLTINGNIVSSTGIAGYALVLQDASSIVTVNGNVYGGSQCYGVYISNGANGFSLTINGNVYGGTGSFKYGISGNATVGNVTINGTLNHAEDITNITGTINNEQDLLFGKLASWTPLYFSGLLDDIRIFNKALSAAEVKQLYNQSKAAIWMGSEDFENF